MKEIIKLIDDVNGARRSLFGLLTNRAVQLGLDADGPYRFFNRAARSSRSKAKAEAKTT